MHVIYLDFCKIPHNILLSSFERQGFDGWVWLKCKTCHLALLNLVQLTLTHGSSLSRSVFRVFLPSSRSTLLASLVSSANLLIHISVCITLSYLDIMQYKLLGMPLSFIINLYLAHYLVLWNSRKHFNFLVLTQYLISPY